MTTNFVSAAPPDKARTPNAFYRGRDLLLCPVLNPEHGKVKCNVAPELLDFDSLLSFSLMDIGWGEFGRDVPAISLTGSDFIGTENSSGVEHLTSEPVTDDAVDWDTTNS